MTETLATKLMVEQAINGTDNYSIQNSAKGYVLSESKAAALIANFAFADSKSVRTSTIILAAFNVLAAIATAASILYSCYSASKRSSSKFRTPKLRLASIYPTETFPLILSIGIVIQGLTLAGVQGNGLKALLSGDCERIAQYLWPALFIVPYIQVVFCLECAIRSLQTPSFQSRGKYDVAICCGTIILMIIATWVPSHIFPEENICFASLVWFISRYGELGLVLLSVSAGLMLFGAFTIFIRLSTVGTMDQHQRIAASHMVYHSALGIVSLAFVIPYFVSRFARTVNFKLAMMATVVLNLSGLTSGLLHLFLKSNMAATSFGPRNGRLLDSGGHATWISGPNEMEFGRQVTSPLSRPRASSKMSRRPDSWGALLGFEKDRPISMESLKSAPTWPPARYDPLTQSAIEPRSTVPRISEPAWPLPGSSKPALIRKQLYSLFPSKDLDSVKAAQPPIQVEPPPKISTHREPTHNTDGLLPPPPIHFGGEERGHRRDSSVVSSATVQIGLRISQAPPTSQDASSPSASLPSTTYNARAPSQQPLPSPVSPRRGFQRQPPRSPLRPNPLNTNTDIPTAEQSPSRKTSAKYPPPNSGASGSNPTIQRVINESTTQLSPLVYSPKRKVEPVSRAPATPQPAVTAPKRAPQDLPTIETVARSSPSRQHGPRSKEGWI